MVRLSLLSTPLMTQRKFIKLSLFFLIVLGVLIRVWRFGSVPLSLYWDEVAIGLDAQSVANTGKDINNQPWFQPLYYSYGDYKAPVYILITTLIAKISPITQFIIRLPSLLAGLLTGVLLFILVKLFNPKKRILPWLVLVSYLIMPWSIHFSRIAMESHLSLFFLTLTVFLSVYAYLKQKPLLLLFSGLAGSIGIFTYISLRLIAPLLYLSTFLIIKSKKNLKLWTFFILGSLIMTLTTLILVKSPKYQTSQAYRLSNDNLITSTTYIDKSISAKGESTQIAPRLFHHRYLYKAEEYLSNYFSHLNPQFLFLSGDSNPRHHSGFGGQLLAIQGIFLLLGIYSLMAKTNRSQTWLILSWLLLSPTISALVNEVPHASRSIYMIIPLAWLIGLGLDHLKDCCPRLTNFLLIILIINLGLYFHHYFSHYPQQSAQAWINPYKQAALFLKDKPVDKKIYLTSQFYQPALYIAFYQNQNYHDLKNYFFFLPDHCPPDSWCVAPPDWQPETTQIISTIPETDKLVIKQAL